jgi:hypothetical protein
MPRFDGCRGGAERRKSRALPINIGFSDARRRDECQGLMAAVAARRDANRELSPSTPELLARGGATNAKV